MDVHRLTRYLNSLREGNLPQEDQRQFTTLLGDFLQASQPEIDDDPDSEADVGEGEYDDDHDDFSDNDATSDPDEPLVFVEEEGQHEPQVSMEWEGDNELLAFTRRRSCKANGAGCKQIKVTTRAPDDPRQGCIAQFSPEEIVALKLSVLDMETGWFSFSF